MNPILEGLPVNEKIQQFLKLLEYPEVQEAMNKKFEEYLQNLGLDKAITRAHRRIDLIEEHLGADEEYCIIKDLDYGEREPRKKVTEQFAQFAAIINNSCQTTEVVMVAGNVTEIRARLLKEKLFSVNPRNGKRFMVSSEIASFLLKEVAEEYKTTEIAARKAALDTMKKALEMYPNELRETKAKKRNAKVIEYIDGVVF